MSQDVEPRESDDLVKLQAAIRRHNTSEIQAILRMLKPQIDGSFGPVNPRLIEVYYKGLAEIAKLYRVYDPPPPRTEELAEERQAAALRATAAAQLEALAARQEPEV